MASVRMWLLSFIIGSFLALAWSEALACRPVPGLKALTLAENFEKAHQVVAGRIVRKTNLGPVSGGIRFDFEVAVTKVWKGQPGKVMKVSTESNTCDPFGQFTETGSLCVLFLNDKSKVISGVSTGEASLCLSESDPQAAKLEEEYDARFASRRQPGHP